MVGIGVTRLYPLNYVVRDEFPDALQLARGRLFAVLSSNVSQQLSVRTAKFGLFVLYIRTNS